MTTTLAKLGFDIDTGNMGKANKSLKDIEKGAQGAEKSVKALSVAAIAAVGAIAGTAAAIVKLTADGLSFVDSQAKMSRALAGTIDGLKALQIAAGEAGIDGLESSLTALNRRLGAVEMEGGPALETMRALGLSARDLSKLDADEKVAAISDAIKSAGMSAQESARHLQHLGFTQANANDFFRAGGDAIRDAREQVRRFNLSMSAVDAARIEAANDSFARISLITESVQNQLAVGLAPVIQFISDLITDAAADSLDFGNAIESAVNRGVRATGFLVDSIDGVRRVAILAGQGVAFVVVAIQRHFINLAETIASGPIDRINALIRGMNAIPLLNLNIAEIEQPQFVRQLREQLAIAEGAVEAAKEAMHATLMEPMPSEALIEAFEKSKQAGIDAAKAFVESRKSQRDATQAVTDELSEASKEYARWILSLKDSIDPMAAAERQITKIWEAFYFGGLDRFVSRSQVEQYVKGLRDAAAGGAKEMESEFQRVSDRVASSLQDAIMSGDWSGMGNAIGGALAGSIADVTSTALAQQIGGQMGSFLGPIGGAIAGGLAGMLANEIFGGSEYTGHRERQERTSELLGGIDTRAAEIANSTQRSASALDQLVGMNRELLNAQRGIETASADLGFNVAQQMAELFTRGAVEVQDSRFGMLGMATQSAKDIGIIISGTLADATVESFLDFKGRIYRESNNVITSTFGDALSSVTDLVRESATALGLSSDDIERAIGGIDLSRFGELSLGAGMGAEEQAEVVNALLATILSDAALAAIPGLAVFVDRVGETVGSVMQQLATDTLAVTNSMSDLGISLGELTGLDLAAVSEQLIEAVGGIDAFQSGVQSFYRAFQSEQEQQRIQFERLTDEFARFGMALPATSAELMRVAQTLDVTTESGREAFAMLIRTQSQLSSYYDTIERRTADLLASLTGGTDAAFRALQGSVSAERAALTQAYQEEQQAIQAATQARMEANRMALDAAKAGLSTIKGEVDGLRSSLDRLRGSFDPITGLRRSGALATLRNALATGDMAGVGDAAGIAAQIDQAGFATREDFMLEQGRTIGLLANVEELGGEQLSTAEKTVKRLEAQTSVIKASGDAQLAALQMGFDEEMQRLDSVISNAEMQLNALRGIDAGLMSIADALVELSKAMGEEAGTGSIENIYRTLLGREADQEGLAYWKSSGLTGQALIEAMRYAAIVNGEVPRFANGGLHTGGLRMVGERGPELEFTGSSRIMSNGDLMSALGGSRDTANELKGLREDLRAANRVIVKQGEEIKQIMRQWDQQGLPEERVLV